MYLLGVSIVPEESYPEFPLSEIRYAKADRLPCPVCGHPTGDCAPDGFAPPRSSVLLRGEVSNTKTSDELQPTVLVEEEIWGEKQITPFTRARVLLAAKGTYVTVEKARELGIL